MKSLAALDRIRLIALGGAAAVLGVLFLSAAAVRRLNFDEPLALRSGWLLWERIDAAPEFYMPFTLILGALGHLVGDPGSVFLIARTICAVAVVLSLLVVARSSQLALAEKFIFLILVFGSGAFASHAFEFRYDTAILVPLLLALIWVGGDGDVRFGRIGFAAAWLSMHHLKGVFFAGAVVAVALSAARRHPQTVARSVRRLTISFVATWLTWIAVSVLLGFGADLVATYSTFFQLASEQPKVWPWQSLGRYLVKDSVWWLVGLAGLVLWLRQGRDAPSDIVRWSLGFTAASLVFLFVHPHPWPYLLAVCVPFIALPAARGFGSRSRVLSTVVALLVTLVALLPASAYRSALRAPRGPEVATLRWLQEASDPADRVFDPSGLAFFLPPCLNEWYLDNLFLHKALRGKWMTELEGFPDPARPCIWLVNTYRASSVPPQYRDRIAGHFVLVHPGIALAIDDPRRSALSTGTATTQQIPSFWW